MKTDNFWMSLLLKPVCFAPEGEGGGGDGGDTGAGEGDGDGSEGADGGDQGKGADDGANGDIALNGGGTAEGQGNSGDGEDGDEGGDDDTDEGGDGDANEDGEDGEDDVVPDEYEWNGLPEGMEVDSTMAEAVAPVFKDLGLTQKQADKLTEAYAGVMQGQAEASAEAARELVQGWQDTAKADKEIGNKNWDASVQAANEVIRKFGTPELVSDVMVGQGIGNHPEVIRILSRVRAAVSDDVFVSGEATDTGEAASPEETWYGSTTPTTKKG